MILASTEELLQLLDRPDLDRSIKERSRSFEKTQRSPCEGYEGRFVRFFGDEKEDVPRQGLWAIRSKTTDELERPEPRNI